MERNRITRNAAKCRKCGDVVESRHRHDFVRCGCGAIAVDGGKAYIRRVGNLRDVIDMSESIDQPMPEPYDGPVYEGLTLRWRMDISSRGGMLPENSELHVLRSTTDQPYGELGPDGVNWLCRAANGETCWSTLESCIERGYLWKP